VDLSPREVPPAPPVRQRSKRWPAILVLVLVIVAGGIVLTQFLTSSIDYYCNVDEVGAKSGCEEGRRLRVQGTVEEGSIQQDGDVTSFMIEFNDVEMAVRYQGDPGGIFQECIPVVVHGRMNDEGVFDGDRVEVKHSNEYEAANGDRLDDAKSAACSQQA
jgi:cytochrome c-type biogenesis protein CcmE